ncbi:MAG: reverse transcriptase family protein [Myxococcales bacterium]
MGFWDKLKSVFGAGPPVSAEMRAKVQAAALAHARAGESFNQLQLAGEVVDRSLPNERQIADLQEAVRALEEVFKSGALKSAGYSRTHWYGNWVYHPVGSPPSQEPPSPSKRAALAASLGDVAIAPPNDDVFTHPTLFGFSEEELRRRTTKVDPVRTGWVGPSNAIPDASDERIAAIDRGLVMRGLLTEAQIKEIHDVGRRWGFLRNQRWMAHALAAKTADEAIKRLREERAARKAELRRLAAERAAQHAEDVARRRAEDIIHLGAGVSGGLADRHSDVEELQKRGVPILSTPADVAHALGLTISKLRWLAFHSEAAERIHYVYFEIPKRSGGMRLLSAPHEELGKAQRWIFENVLSQLATEEPAHGFITGRSTLTNATPHLARDLVVNLDLSDFFPTITFPRVRGVFQRLGYSPAVATVFALLCTECPRRKMEYDGTTYWVAVGPRGLPQGACTSPALSNQVAKKLDRRLGGMAKKHGWTYTRYADDLTFSRGSPSPTSAGDGVAMMLARVRHIVDEEGFAINVKKGRVQRASGRQSVTGIVVNQKPSLPREELRQLRAILHNARKTGLAAQNRQKLPHFEAWLRGKIAYVMMVDRQKGLAMLKQLDALPKSGAGVA